MGSAMCTSAVVRSVIRSRCGDNEAGEQIFPADQRQGDDPGNQQVAALPPPGQQQQNDRGDAQGDHQRPGVFEKIMRKERRWSRQHKGIIAASGVKGKCRVPRIFKLPAPVFR